MKWKEPLVGGEGRGLSSVGESRVRMRELGCELGAEFRFGLRFRRRFRWGRVRVR